MISAIILGNGNLASHLISSFSKSKNIELTQVYGRKRSSLKNIDNHIETTSNLENLKEADVYIIAISDDAISEFSSQLDLQNKLVVHTSGGTSMSNLKNKGNRGVFYPLQTFSTKDKVNFKEIPICIEAENKKDLSLLNKLAHSISDKVYTINSEQRKYLHIAAVFTNNFVNHFYKIGSDICFEHDIPFDILQPLILESAKKITQHNPATIQTGPAHRNDKETIANHLNLLSGDEKKIYKLLTESIQKTYGKKL